MTDPTEIPEKWRPRADDPAPVMQIVVAGASSICVWTDEAVDWLVRAQLQGWSYGQCALALGVSRNTIAGKLGRLKVKPNVAALLGAPPPWVAEHNSGSSARERRERASLPARAPKPKSVKATKAAIARAALDERKARQAEARAALREQRETGAYPPEAMSFRELFAQPRMPAVCRFTLSDAGGLDAIACGKPTMRPHDPTCAWCADHHALVYEPATEKIRVPNDATVQTVKRGPRFFGFGRNMEAA